MTTKNVASTKAKAPAAKPVAKRPAPKKDTAVKKAIAKKSPAKKSAAKTKAPVKKASKRELLEPTSGDKRFVRRKPGGEFGKTVDVGKSLSADSRSKAKTKVPKGQGDRGDTKR